MPIITYPLNGIEYDAHDAETYLCTRTSGVFSAENNFAISVSGTRQVTVSPGIAWINNGEFKGKSVVSTAPENITIPSADGSLNRIDLLVLRFDVSTNKTIFAIKSGVPAVSPVSPKPSKESAIYELGLYTIYISAGSVNVIESDISSVMLDESYCGVMRDAVTGLPTAQIQKQAEELIEEIRQSLGDVVSADATITNDGGDARIDVEFQKDAEGNINLAFDFKNSIPDKAEIIEGVIQALPTWTGGSY
ncbi:MAG: hypothetical protein J6S23_01760 [Clostridia bacterium]|nr:hypothetical protein [Clostridia bacterium]